MSHRASTSSWRRDFDGPADRRSHVDAGSGLTLTVRSDTLPVQVAEQELCNGKTPTYKYIFMTQIRPPCSRVSCKRPCKAPGCCQSFTRRQQFWVNFALKASALSLRCLANKASQVRNAWTAAQTRKQRCKTAADSAPEQRKPHLFITVKRCVTWREETQAEVVIVNTAPSWS